MTRPSVTVHKSLVEGGCQVFRLQFVTRVTREQAEGFGDTVRLNDRVEVFLRSADGRRVSEGIARIKAFHPREDGRHAVSLYRRPVFGKRERSGWNTVGLVLVGGRREFRKL